ncbi:MAG: hypothetical protein R2827_07330 [Bdellovibrionales bacterium]
MGEYLDESRFAHTVGGGSSGLGREGGEDAYRFFTEVKNVCIEIGESNA